jgi:hypothetical protein
MSINLRKYAVFSLIFGLVALSTVSCKKGCRDSTAYNYNHSAKVEDGSCLYCDSTKTISASGFLNVTDLNPSSSYFEQNVMNVTISGYAYSYSGNGCNLIRHITNGDSTCENVYNTITFANNTQSNMTISGSILLEYFSQFSVDFTYSFSGISIPAFSQTVVQMPVYCVPPSNLFQMEAFTQNNIVFQYH